MTVRPDNRLADAPMVSVGCRQCGATVGVRKSSRAQTTVQWNAEATAACVQRRAAEALAGHGGSLFLVCSKLRESIDDAVRRGQLVIVDEDPNH